MEEKRRAEAVELKIPPTPISNDALEDMLVAAGDVFRGHIFPFSTSIFITLPPFNMLPQVVGFKFGWEDTGLVEVRRKPIRITSTYYGQIATTIYADDAKIGDAFLFQPFEPDFSIFYAKRRNIKIGFLNKTDSFVDVIIDLRLLFVTTDTYDRLYRLIVERWLKLSSEQLDIEIAPKGEAKPWRLE